MRNLVALLAVLTAAPASAIAPRWSAPEIQSVQTSGIGVSPFLIPGEQACDVAERRAVNRAFEDAEYSCDGEILPIYMQSWVRNAVPENRFGNTVDSASFDASRLHGLYDRFMGGALTEPVDRAGVSWSSLGCSVGVALEFVCR